ncbi:MAG: 50S ribosomal protein L4 [Alphaproteobacteria bacterium]|nr:50S ribosomal protein L4 [Alphaproteobacteria bacterium]
MKIAVIDMNKKEVGSLELADDIFGLKPRIDILEQMVNWQLARRRAGTHKVKNRAEINRTSKKMYGQKGTGQARHGSARVPQFRGGGRAFGPVVRSHGYKLNKKFRTLALKHALSAKVGGGTLMVIDSFEVKTNKTSQLVSQLKKLGIENGLIIGGATLPATLQQAAGNIKNIDVLPLQGVNVYDIMRRHNLVMTREAIEGLAQRLSATNS